MGEGPAFVAGDGVDEVAVGEARAEVGERAGRFDGGEQHGEGEGEAEADEHPLDDQRGERERVGGDVLPVQGEGGEADRDAHGDDAAHAWGDHRRGERRGEQEQRADPREHEDEAGELVARELVEDVSQRAHQSTSVGIEV